VIAEAHHEAHELGPNSEWSWSPGVSPRPTASPGYRFVAYDEVLGSLWPALRAARVDPIQVMRRD
jgi:hypothetical protein